MRAVIKRYFDEDTVSRMLEDYEKSSGVQKAEIKIQLELIMEGIDNEVSRLTNKVVYMAKIEGLIRTALKAKANKED